MIEGLAYLLVKLIVLGLVFWLLYWLLGQVGLPEPFNKVALVVLAVVAVLILLDFVFGLGFVGNWRRL